MQELIDRITASVGIDSEVAQKSVGLILSFLKKEAPAEAAALIDQMPGATDLAAAAGAEAGGGGLLGGIMGMMGGGGIMGLGTQLMGAGLSMGQIKDVSKEVFAFAKEKAGEDAVGAVVGSIPGLSQFI